MNQSIASLPTFQTLLSGGAQTLAPEGSMIAVRDTVLYIPEGMELDRPTPPAFAILPVGRRVNVIETKEGSIVNRGGMPERRRWTHVYSGMSEGWVAADDLSPERVLHHVPTGSVTPAVPGPPDTEAGVPAGGAPPEEKTAEEKAADAASQRNLLLGGAIAAAAVVGGYYLYQRSRGGPKSGRRRRR